MYVSNDPALMHQKCGHFWTQLSCCSWRYPHDISVSSGINMLTVVQTNKQNNTNSLFSSS